MAFFFVFKKLACLLNPLGSKAITITENGQYPLAVLASVLLSHPVLRNKEQQFLFVV